MIHRVFSSLKSFKELSLHPGLNVVLCEKTPGASDQQTRNRAGKSALVELIHFVCGSNCTTESTFRTEALLPFVFGLELDVFGKKVRASRSGSEPSKIVVEYGGGDTLHWPKQPKVEKESGRHTIPNTAWRVVLGRAFFNLQGNIDEDESDEGSGLTFRQLFAYFARQEGSGAMRDAMKNHSQQKTGNQQIAISYLLGLDWTIAQQWETVRQKEKQILALKQIVGQGLLTDVLDSAAHLRALLVVSDEKLKRLTTTLQTFKVHEQYGVLEREASQITKELGELADENASDRLYTAELESAMHSETPPAPDDLKALYEEAGVVLPDLVRKRYEDVAKFHESVVRNRRSYLQGEHAAAVERVRRREDRRAVLDHRRSELMGMLRSHGALDEFVALQAEHGRLAGDVAALRRRFEAAAQLESTHSSLESERLRLVDRLRQEFADRSAIIDEAIRTFSDIVDELYGETGVLEFRATSNGPEVRINIKGDRSRGINNMEIFCFDMMLQKMCARQKMGPGFLVHDSHLFDGVDPRQTGKALALGAKLADEIGFQYIVTLNSDTLDELPEFDRQKYVIEPKLTDTTDSGGLFGFRFEPPRDRPTEKKPRKTKAGRKRPQ